VHPASLPIDDLLADCDETPTRRGGPGGQHRNKVSTAVVLRHRPSGITAEASERRSQTQNRAVAIQRLRLRLAIELRTRLAAASDDDGESMSDLWRRRRSGTAIRVAADHEDYPALVAEALDRLDESRGRLAVASRRLGVTGSQLAGLLARHPAAWAALQSLRCGHRLAAIRR
jgi:hypothetical protein